MKNNSIDVSILICTYNHKQYIGQAIESILSQRTEYNYELIIGDDASKDGTADIIRDYAERDRRIIPILRKENIGATRNVYDMSRRARGSYTTGCDGDDYFCDPDRIQRQIEFLENHRVYSAICGKCNLVDENNCPVDESLLDEKVKFWKFDKRIFTWADFEQWKMPGHMSSFLNRNYNMNNTPSIVYEAHDTVGDRTGVLLNLLHGPIYCTEDINSCYRLRRDKGHFMSNYQGKNLRAKEVHMMRCLEEYALSCGKKLDLGWIKKQRLVGAVCVWMKNQTEENMEVIKNILKECNNSAEYRKILLETVILKAFYWNVLKEDRDIEIN